MVNNVVIFASDTGYNNLLGLSPSLLLNNLFNRNRSQISFIYNVILEQPFAHILMNTIYHLLTVAMPYVIETPTLLLQDL